MAEISAVLGSIAAIVGAIYGLFKWVTWKTQTTTQEADQKIQAQINQEKAKFEETGRPQ